MYGSCYEIGNTYLARATLLNVSFCREPEDCARSIQDVGRDKTVLFRHVKLNDAKLSFLIHAQLLSPILANLAYPWFTISVCTYRQPEYSTSLEAGPCSHIQSDFLKK
jgi:hypothetical protein